MTTLVRELTKEIHQVRQMVTQKRRHGKTVYDLNPRRYTKRLGEARVKSIQIEKAARIRRGV